MIKFFSLFSGSSGNCSYITDGRTRILIDAGVSARRISTALSDCDIDVSQIDAILVTHEHGDHIAGIDVLSRRRGLKVFANDATLSAMKLSAQAYSNTTLIAPKEKFAIGDIIIEPFVTPHDTPQSLGFVFTEGKSGKKLGFASDLGHISREVDEALTGCEAIYLESNHDLDILLAGSYPYMLKKRISCERGHLSNDACAQFLKKTCKDNTSRVMLGHLSRENNYPHIAYETSYKALAGEEISVGHDMLLHIAPRDTCSEVITL